MILRWQFSVFTLFISTGSFAQVGIGTSTPNDCAALEVQSTTAGLLVPRLTTNQRSLINNPVPGLIIYNLNTFQYQGYSNNEVLWLNMDSNNTAALQQNIYVGDLCAQTFKAPSVSPVYKISAEFKSINNLSPNFPIDTTLATVRIYNGLYNHSNPGTAVAVSDTISVSALGDYYFTLKNSFQPTLLSTYTIVIENLGVTPSISSEWLQFTYDMANSYTNGYMFYPSMGDSPSTDDIKLRLYTTEGVWVSLN